MSRARRIGVPIALFAVSALSFGLGARLLLQRQAAIARKRIGKPLGETALDADRIWRSSLPGAPIKLLILGDSLAAGLGAQRRKDTLGGRIAKGLAKRLRRPVQLHTAAVVGSESHMLTEQLAALPPGYRPHVAVIVVGGNDVTHLLPPEQACRHLEQTVLRLREAGAAVVVGTCPDLGALRAVPQPLRTLLSRMSQRMAVVQKRAVLRAGGVPVSLRRTVSPIFRAEPGEMFSLDQFHPSAAGYRRTAEALLPAVVAAIRSR